MMDHKKGWLVSGGRRMAEARLFTIQHPLSTVPGSLAKVCSGVLQRHFLWFLLFAYLAALLTPELGLWISAVNFGEITLFQQSSQVTLTMVMLAGLLLDAGLGVESSRFKGLPHVLLLLAVGLLANHLVPVAFLFAVFPLLGLWLSEHHVQTSLLSFALIAAMPIAASSTAWSKKAGGSVALSLGLVVFSTLLSPMTTPLVLTVVGQLVTGDHAEDLRDLTENSMAIFLFVCVIAPSLLGLFLAWVIGRQRLAPAKQHLKLVSSINLLLLVHANAAVSLSEAVAFPDLAFLGATAVTAITLCGLCFGSGFLIALLLGAGRSQRASLMFGLGMNNNGTGLVLASVGLSDHPSVMLPLLTYNLVQHLIAGFVTSRSVRESQPES